MIGSYQIKTPASTTIVTVDEAKAHCHVDFADDDALFAGLVAAVTARLDLEGGIIGRPLFNQQWTWTGPAPLAGSAGEARLRGLPSAAGFLIERAPLVSIDSVEYLSGGTYQTLASNLWTSRRISPEATFVRLVTGGAWPVYDTDEQAWRITMTLGYGTAESSIPAPIRSAALLMIGHLYQNREAVTGYGAALQETPMGVEALLAPYRKAAF